MFNKIFKRYILQFITKNNDKSSKNNNGNMTILIRHDYSLEGVILYQKL
jgi:hypothetical protein